MNRPLVERGGEREKLPPFPFPFLAIFPQTESLFTGYWEIHLLSSFYRFHALSNKFHALSNRNKHIEPKSTVNSVAADQIKRSCQGPSACYSTEIWIPAEMKQITEKILISCVAEPRANYIVFIIIIMFLLFL